MLETLLWKALHPVRALLVPPILLRSIFGNGRCTRVFVLSTIVGFDLLDSSLLSSVASSERVVLTVRGVLGLVDFLEDPSEVSNDKSRIASSALNILSSLLVLCLRIFFFRCLLYGDRWPNMPLLDIDDATCEDEGSG